MARVEGKVVDINRPVEEVWKFITDYSNLPKLNLGEEVKQTSEGSIGLGTTLQVSGRLFRRHVAYNLQITDFEPKRKIALEFTNGFLKGSKEIFSPNLSRAVGQR